jgi:cytochrome c oxidase assembly protein subunit 11
MSAPNRKRMAWTAAIATAAVLGMTGMAFAAVPLYQAFCRITGYGGTTQEASVAPGQVLERRINVRFDSNIAPGLPVEFEPRQLSETLRIGETGLAFYRLRNLSDQPIVARATYNVTPHVAGQYFAKLECFCFQDQTIGAGEEAELPVVFFVDPEMADDPDTREIETLTLSYTFFRAVDQSAAQQSSVNQRQTPSGDAREG